MTPTDAPPPADADDAWTVKRLRAWTADFFRKRGSESPGLDAEVLLAHVMGWQRYEVYTRQDEEVGSSDRARLRDLVRRRGEGMPVAYLVGRKEFFRVTLAVSPAVLIPRPDTEEVVVQFLDLLKAHPAPLALDVGTGSGCIALACAERHPAARFLATDISPEALALARANAEALGLADRVEFRLGDLFAPVADAGPFDAILSNPPYIPTAVIPTLEPGVRDYEPRLALDGGEDGLRVVSRLIAEAAPFLKHGGHLILEIGTAQEHPVREMIAARPEFELAPTIRDAANHPRVIRATRRA
jgi:release factor glutamine methyltransferase